MLPFLLPAIGAGLSSLLGFGSGAANRKAQERANAQQRKFALKMYGMQKQDALAFWQKQNKYNSPAEQMRRFQEAGLNPNLMYGQGNSGNAGAINVPTKGDFNPRPESFGQSLAALSQGVGQYFNFRTQLQQVNNLGAQNDVLHAEARLKNAMAFSQLVKGKSDKFKYDVLKMFGKQNLLMSKQWSLDKLSADVGISWNQNKLLMQKYYQLERTNPVVFKKMQKALGMMGIQMEKLRKETNLVGLSGKTEIGSLLRFLFTAFGVNIGDLGSHFK